ncbi:PD40 domain-containing protein [Microbispora sp. ATCC PTA-5024]|uniref:PD40 domain-containing protein n=1 Tax=Microbispora sp. ATCC PTA-5024 TaxID=316330 RepID=UPI0003DD1BA4|nr:PD40 domain-containing protein [Microbispora sp. ATCC PTA-5024]ETK37366.1 TolB-like translocation protein [Microbispora sp. ATCC PTA-5024]
MTPRLTRRARVVTLLAAVALLGSVGAASVLRAADRAEQRDRPHQGGPSVAGGAVTLDGGGRRMVFRNMAWGPYRDDLVSVPAGDPGGPRTAAAVRCLRFHAAAGTGVCLRKEETAVGESYLASVLDSRLRTLREFPLAGIPSRTRVSPSGRMAAWTVFVGGDSYAGGAFSTRTSILDTRTWTLTPSLEAYAVVKDGRPYHAADVNLWGVTFSDDGHFYATLATAGRTYLVRGDVAARTVTTLRPNVECPSLSPDGTRLVFKKRVPGLSPDAPWRLYALDLRTMRETPLAETRSVDDQVVWAGGNTVLYGLAGDFGDDLWSVPADGTGRPSRIAVAALNPAFV